PKPTLLLSADAAARGHKPKYQHFVGLAVMMEGVAGEALKHTPKRPCPPWWQTKFEIYAHDPNANADWFVHQNRGLLRSTLTPPRGRPPGGSAAAGTSNA